MAEEKNKKSEHGSIVHINDPVNHPAHYTTGKIEVIDYIEDQKLPYHLGNAVKYISRAGKKDKRKKVEDLRKAVWYIERYIRMIGENGSDTATIRSTVVPRRMTSSSLLNRRTRDSAKIKSRLPDRIIRPISRGRTVLPSRFRRL